MEIYRFDFNARNFYSCFPAIANRNWQFCKFDFNSLTPLNTLILGAIAFGVSFQRRQLWGVIIGLIGSLLLVLMA
jgi:hypothetical protein